MQSSSVLLLTLALVTAAPAMAAGPGFRTQHLLEDHFARHGRQFGTISQEQYLRMAQQLRDAKPGKYVLEAKRRDGGGAKFDKRNNHFVAYDRDGTLRTFFIPNDGIHYFDLQTKSHGPPQR